MKQIFKFLPVLGLSVMCTVTTLSAQTMRISYYSNGPTVSNIGSTTATLSIKNSLYPNEMNSNDFSSSYFEYYKTNQVCIAIYPTPLECLPKKTAIGVTSVKITDLTPNTSYSVVHKKDNTIRCITAPCQDNSYNSQAVEFKTLSDSPTVVVDKSLIFNKNLGYRMSGQDVTKLQVILVQRGFMSGDATGYFGVKTLKAVKDLQKTYGISPTGFFGPLTRNSLGYQDRQKVIGEYLEGSITAVYTGCFSDGECSISVDGKKVVTTIGWSREIVGRIFGTVDSVGDAENKIGSRVKVFAARVGDDYTLYGSKDFYIEVK